jgi:hypothetical protein
MNKLVSKKVAALKSSVAAKQPETAKPVDPASLALHICEVTGGKNFKLGAKFECHAAGLRKRDQKPFAWILVDGELRFIQPKFLKAIKKMADEEAAVIEAAQEEDREATILVACKVISETEKAIKVRTHGWKDLWIPKGFAEKMCDHPENKEEIILLVARWKMTKGQPGACVEDLDEKQEHLQSIVDAHEAELEAKKREAEKPQVIKADSVAAVKAKAFKKA